jgi:hypothetical protein
MPLLGTRGAASARGFGFAGGAGGIPIDFLIVAGGGGGANAHGGGAGAGGMKTDTTLLKSGVTYTITVGRWRIRWSTRKWSLSYWKSRFIF